MATKVPKTAKHAIKSEKYKKLAKKHTDNEKRRWLLLKQKGKWRLARAASATASGPHTVCYYDPSTGFYDDCYTS